MFIQFISDNLISITFIAAIIYTVGSVKHALKEKDVSILPCATMTIKIYFIISVIFILIFGLLQIRAVKIICCQN